MNKTNKSIAKRFKVTGTGKVMRRTPGYRHMLRSKSTKQRRKAGQDQSVSPGFARMVRKAMPFSF